MWCDDFDADLLAVVPGAAGALGATADVQLSTYSSLTGGKINNPSCWSTYGPLFAAYFWTGPVPVHPPGLWTDEEIVPCTFLEAVRDEWVHSCEIVVNEHSVWRPPVRLMERLMYDVRGWTPLADEERERIRGDVLRSLESAARRLGQLGQVGDAAR